MASSYFYAPKTNTAISSTTSNHNGGKNVSSLTNSKKEHPWQDTIRKLEDERYQQETCAAPPLSSSMPRYPGPQQQQQQQQRPPQAARGESVRVNYAYSSRNHNQSSGSNSNNHPHNRRRPRVGIFRSSSPASASHTYSAAEESLELELNQQDTSRTTNSTTTTHTSSGEGASPQSSPKRPYSPASERDDELAYIHRRRQRLQEGGHSDDYQYQDQQHNPAALVPSHNATQTRRLVPNTYYESVKTGKPPRQQRQRRWTPSPNPTNPFAPTPPPNQNENPYYNNSNRSTNPFAGDSPLTTPSYQQQQHQQQHFEDEYEDDPQNYHQQYHNPTRRSRYSQSSPMSSAGVSSADDPFAQLPSGSSSSGDNPFRGLVSGAAAKAAEYYNGIGNASADSNNNNNDDHNTTTSSNQSQTDPKVLERLGLHILCGEATSQHDIAWRNALYLLGMQPSLAQELDQQGRTALHVACEEGHAAPYKGSNGGEQPEEQPRQPVHPTAPPSFMIRALLVAHPDAVQHTDQDGRLPLHCLAAASGDVDAMQLLVEAHPESIGARDAMGWTPLHLFLLNPRVLVTVAQTQILLGLTLRLNSPQSEEQQNNNNNNNLRENTNMRQRRGDHLRVGVDELERMRRQGRSYPRWQPIQRYQIPEDILNSYPDDVRVCLRRLAQWERKEHRLKQQQKQQDCEAEPEAPYHKTAKDNEKQQHQSSREGKESPFAAMGIDPTKEQELNPAAMPTLHDGRLPLHMIVHRGLLDVALQRSRLDEQDESKARGHTRDRHPPRGQPTLLVIVRLLISAHAEGLIAREINGLTPLLLAMVTASDVLPSQELLEMLLGKRTAGYESLPSWAEDTPYPLQHVHVPNSPQGLSPAAQRYSNPAMVATLDTCQLPLHLAAEDWGDHPSLLLAVFESYPGGIHVQDARGRMPLHVLLENYRHITPHPQIVALLLSERVARTFTDEGQLPFDLLVACGPYLPSEALQGNEPLSPNGTVVHPDPYKAFQKFFQASILASSTVGRLGSFDNNFLRRRAEASVFLVRLRMLPPWLRRQACSAPFVQKILLEELASPSKCAYILMYGLLMVFLLVFFRRQMEYFIDTALLSRAQPSPEDLNSTMTLENQSEVIFLDSSARYDAWNTLAIYGFSAGSIGFQVIFWTLSCSLGEFQHLCLFSIWRWIDLAAVATSVATSILIHEAYPDDQVLFVGTAATGLLWCSLVGFLANWWYEMAFFSGALLKVCLVGECWYHLMHVSFVW